MFHPRTHVIRVKFASRRWKVVASMIRIQDSGSYLKGVCVFHPLLTYLRDADLGVDGSARMEGRRAPALTGPGFPAVLRINHLSVQLVFRHVEMRSVKYLSVYWMSFPNRDL